MCPKKKDILLELTHFENDKDVQVIKCKSKEELTEWVQNLTPYCVQEREQNSTIIFGATLKEALKPGQLIPDIVTRCIEYVDDKALTVEGIFRLSGAQTKIDSYVEQFNSGEPVSLSDEQDAHTITGLLKLYFRDLAEPLIVYDLYDSFVQVQLVNDPLERRKYMRLLVKNLPEANRAVLKFLISFLGRVTQHEKENKMAIHNIATVFAPNLLKSRESNTLQLVQDTPTVNGIVHTLITEYEYIFADEDPEDTFVMVQSIYEYTGKNDNEISFDVGEEIKVTNQRKDGWWFGENKNGKQGLFPGSYVKIIPPNLNKKRKFLKELKEAKKRVEDLKKNRRRSRK